VTWKASAIAICLAASLLEIRGHAGGDAAEAWDPASAAMYLDQRARWWASWPAATRDHDTYCVSCHTALPYALARPTLRATLGETGPAGEEIKLLDNVTRRVRLWKESSPYYPWPASRSRIALDWLAEYAALVAPSSQPARSTQSRGTEAVFNAVILAGRDARTGTVGDDTRQAFDELWLLQAKKGELAGAWPWLNFRNEPWEAANSAYFGAAMAAIAVGTSPQHDLSSPAIQGGLELLRAYLKRAEPVGPLFDRVMLLWASTKLSGLLDLNGQRGIEAALLSKQREDGGWSLSSLASWKRADGTSPNTQSDGYATGLITLALQEAGVPRDRPDVRRGLIWLAQHQNRSSGAWPGFSLNVARDPASDAGRFMSDAATAYAVLALTRRRS
jgi:squalene-hopene/tetraprenyl-beta-curcumene cyclase